jgi:predicted TPR repeat methyltransferase
VLQIVPEDLDIVAQRIDGPPFDLMVATNVFVYYDRLDQSLALANVEAMLKPGGILLSNNALLELPASRMRSRGYVTAEYSDRPDDGDHIVWYQRTP